MVKKNSGFTLIEAMMTVAIIGIVAAIAPQVITQSTKVYILGRARLELQREARATMYLVTRELRQARSNTIVIDQVSGQPYYSRIRFTKIAGGSVNIYQTGARAFMTINTSSSTITRNLAYLSFTFPRSDDMTIASVSLTLQEQIYGGLYKALHMASERVRVMN